MRIEIVTPAGVAQAIADTRWAPLAEVLETVASRPRASTARREAAILAWCRRGGATRPAVDDVQLEGEILTLLEYDPAEALAGEDLWDCPTA